ncbi:transposase [Pantoea ananatis]|uniref:transposase n=1 Tax=Pantoea ananas TaxID=553 RepID=UPI003864246D|nr:hypothetical protein [Pantoea ananatis]MCW0341359.1 hypothetical protein [Pantoea ananatis]MCW0359841.1 hypothetical protein [Pantoea ananatis]MCW0364427.1 hypothetical protein [Pantoea ananatis]
MTLWLTSEGLAKWKVAQVCLREVGVVILTLPFMSHTIRVVTALRIPLRPMESVFTLMNVSLNVPDHTSVCRRAAVLHPLPRIPLIPSEGDLHILIDSTGLCTVAKILRWGFRRRTPKTS